jgi:hypothetical protein
MDRAQAMRARFLPSLLLSVAAAALGLSGCTDVCACPPTPATARLSGRVTVSGEPMSGARVFGYGAPAAGCTFDGVEGFALTGTDGTFVMGLLAPTARDSLCVFVYALSRAGSAVVESSDTTLVVLDFRYDEPQDSARLDLILEAR